jgi:hypothetical protein
MMCCPVCGGDLLGGDGDRAHALCRCARGDAGSVDLLLRDGIAVLEGTARTLTECALRFESDAEASALGLARGPGSPEDSQQLCVRARERAFQAQLKADCIRELLGGRAQR